MKCSTIRLSLLTLVGTIVVFSATMTTAAAMQVSPEPVAAPVFPLTPKEVQARFLEQGFDANAPISPLIDGSAAFIVEDPAEHGSTSARILMVVVYPDLASADAAHHQGAHLMPGYGPSVWAGNVALVQTTRAALDRRYAVEPHHLASVAIEPDRQVDVSTPVGLDFRAVLGSDPTDF